MKKSFLVLLLLALSSAMIIGCSSKPDESPSQPTLRVFMEVELESGLLGAIEYFTDNYDVFTVIERKDFADSIVIRVNARLAAASWVNF